MKISLCQMTVTDDRAVNIAHAEEVLRKAADAGAALAILPEMFTITYSSDLFFGASEQIIGGESYNMLSRVAKTTGMTIIGGSIPERHGDKIFNTSMSFDGDGNYLGSYRKAHLFDVDVDGFRFMESDCISAGDNRPLIIDSPVKTGVSICFDIRFPEWSRLMMDAGVDLIALPAAFARKTGPLHWELLLRARALDNQCFVAGVAPAMSANSYGHTMLCAPDGSIEAQLGEGEGILTVELDTEKAEMMRKSIPVKTARRKDLYA